MRLKYPQLLAAALFVLVCGSLHSAKRQLQPAPLPSGLAIALGNSAIALDGPWKFSPGDSPWSMNPSAESSNLLINSPDWAQPRFDDSEWANVDLTPPTGSVDAVRGGDGWVRGWTRRGYPQLSGFAWYRIRLTVTDPAQQLWLKMPGSFDDAYEIYANGHYVGQFGEFTRHSVTFNFSQPASFPLPRLGSDGRLEIAIRFYMTPVALSQMPDAGGLHAPPVIGMAPAIRLLERAETNANAHSYFGEMLTAFLFLLVLPLAIWALAANPGEWAWSFLVTAIGSLILVTCLHVGAELTTSVSTTAYLNVSAILLPLSVFAWILFWWAWFGLRSLLWIPIASAILTAGHIAFFMAMVPGSAGDSASVSSLQLFNALTILILVAQSALLFFVLREGFRRALDEAILATLPILAFILANFTRYLTNAFDVPYVTRIFGLGFSLIDMERILMILVVAALAARRFLESSVERHIAHRALEQDLEQARELQQRVLVPEDLHSTHFDVEAEYHAAQVVGGDFFVTIVGRDGSLCVVIGDVSGKGISAAMLVAVLVGAARTRAAQDFDPITMLQTLDERMSGHSGDHFATCLAAQLFPNGVLRLANAGHLRPYLNGCELDLDGSLPLGIAGKLSPAKKQFQLRQGDILTFMTDGVPEAKNKDGELFGFEQARVLSQKAPGDIVSEVQAYGQVQDDDITVLRVTFVRSEGIGPITNVVTTRQTVHA
jgi:serine phosphatase RsbU (regulator of sigma subunit)